MGRLSSQVQEEASHYSLILLRLGMELGERLLGAAGVEEYSHGPDLT